MSETVEEFLQRKGGVGLLSVLHEGGKTYSEIESEVSITSDTISKRKDEALEIGLIDIQAARRNNRTVNEYHLTDFGEAVTERMAVKGVVSNYQSMRMHQRKVEEKTADVVDWLSENPDYFVHFEEVEKETLIDRTTAKAGSAPSAEGDRDVELPDQVSGQTGDTDADEDAESMSSNGSVEDGEDQGEDDQQSQDAVEQQEEGDDGRVQKDLSEVDLEDVAKENKDTTTDDE